jgi:hypothetical protein
MFRRRCSSIVVVDAGGRGLLADDLGKAIRKRRSTSASALRCGSRCVYPRIGLEAESDLTESALGFACGDIDYGGGHTGCLLYVKPSFLAKIPADMRSYGAVHKLFPHESTLDQWFSESQFESYRMLGRYQMAELVGDAGTVELAAMFKSAHLAGQWAKSPADVAG